MTQFQQARTMLERALTSPHSSFYRDWYAAQGFDYHKLPADPATWSRLPLLTKADLVSTPLPKRLFVPLMDVETIRFTSGTSGSGILMMPRRVPPPAPDGTPYFPGKAHLSLFFNTFTWVSARGNYNQRIIAGDPAQLPASAALAAEAGVDAISAPASLLIALKPHLAACGVLGTIHYLNITSERLSRLQLQALREQYPGALITNIYALQETSWIAYASPHAPDPTLLEPLPDHYIEIVSDDGTHPLETLTEPVEGNLVVTALYPAAFPHIRYRTGDRARAHPRAGGLPLIEILGRAEEERIGIPGGMLVLAELERALIQTFGGAVAYFECVIDEQASTTGVETTAALTLYVAGDIPEPQDSGIRLAKALRVNRMRTWHDGVLHGLYAPLVCTFKHPEAADRKHKPIRDARR